MTPSGGSTPPGGPGGEPGPVALVTGAARGIGESIAEAFAFTGYDVVLADLDIVVQHTAERLAHGTGRRVTGVVADVGVRADVEDLLASVRDQHGRLDALVNNAGGSAHTPLEFAKVSDEHYDRVMDANVRGTFLLCQICLPLLAESGGSVVNIASIAGRAGLPMLSVQYSAAKAAVIGMSRTLAAHLGPLGVRVNVVAPGFIRSGERADAIWASRDVDRMLEAIPLRRRGENREIADICVLLTSEAASYITGAVVDANGGFLAV